jgi:hypothetical protein
LTSSKPPETLSLSARILTYARYRISAFLDEVEQLRGSDFPYPHSSDALDLMRELFQRKLDRLASFTAESDESTVRNECSLALRDLFIYLPLLGFILRSTNVRNAFEFFGPFLRLAGDVLEPAVPIGQRKTKLLLSSEWDYSPFTYSDVRDLPRFVLIGLPAPESSNPLLFPLAGHELGHSVWLARDFDTHFRARIKQEVLSAITQQWATYEVVFPLGITPAELTTDVQALESWAPCIEYCTSQAQETFCDAVGLRLFGEGYLHAFAYLLSPKIGRRSWKYPPNNVRVSNLLTAAATCGLGIPADYATFFDDDSTTDLARADEFRLSVADKALTALVVELIAKAIDCLGHIPPPSKEEVDRILGRFDRVVPAEECRGMADILNAAWQAFHKTDLWNAMPTISKKRDLVLKELVLKNLEVFHIEQILSEYSR